MIPAKYTCKVLGNGVVQEQQHVAHIHIASPTAQTHFVNSLSAGC